MKGFGIEIKNNLLDPKHLKNMGMSVWLYMWMIDKMTSIGENGIGKVLGGKPIKYKEIKDELNIGRITYVRWVATLRKFGYINVLRTPCGIVFTVNKAFKRFKGRCIMNDTAMYQKRTCNIRHNNDIINKDTRDAKHHVTLNKKSMDEDRTLEECNDDGIPKQTKVKSSLPKVSKNKLARELQFEFQMMAKKFLRTDVMIDSAGYFSVLRAINPERGKMTPDQLKKMFEEWFMTQGPDRVTSITACLSNRNIERYKLQNGIISK
jgi:hypothetical protein